MSLGYVSTKNPAHKRPAPPVRVEVLPDNAPRTTRVSVASKPGAAYRAVGPSRRWLHTLLALNAVLFVAHLAATIVAASATIAFPVTVFETRISECVRTQFQCLYTSGNVTHNDGKTADLTGECSDPSPFLAADCGAASDDPACGGSTTTLTTSASSDLFTDYNNSPLLAVYELAMVSLSGDASQDGKAATRGILIAIEAVTAAFHLIYAFVWARLLWWDADDRLTNRLLVAGGLPARWYEYAITASLMSFFISNGANVFDINALLAIALATFALMYIGVAIELMLYQGRRYGALVLLYVPGTALFLAGWLPSLRQAFGDVARLSCVGDGPVNVFTCQKSCFGAEVPIVLFVFILLLLFAVFPLITLTKIYQVGGWEARWTTPTLRVLERLCCVQSVPLMQLVHGPLRAAVHLLFFVAFALWGGVLAVATVIKDSLWPLGAPFIDEQTVAADDELKWNALMRGEFMYAIASATSKLFLFIFFMTSFARRDW